MTEIIGVVNQKGGVSKTSTALALWTGIQDTVYRLRPTMQSDGQLRS